MYGDNSSTTIEAKQLLVESLLRLRDVVKLAYEGKALVTVVTSDASHTRYSRSLMAADENVEGDKVKITFCLINHEKK